MLLYPLMPAEESISGVDHDRRQHFPYVETGGAQGPVENHAGWCSRDVNENRSRLGANGEITRKQSAL